MKKIFEMEGRGQAGLKQKKNNENKYNYKANEKRIKSDAQDLRSSRTERKDT